MCVCLPQCVCWCVCMSFVWVRFLHLHLESVSSPKLSLPLFECGSPLSQLSPPRLNRVQRVHAHCTYLPQIKCNISTLHRHLMHSVRFASKLIHLLNFEMQLGHMTHISEPTNPARISYFPFITHMNRHYFQIVVFFLVNDKTRLSKFALCLWVVSCIPTKCHFSSFTSQILSVRKHSLRRWE